MDNNNKKMQRFIEIKFRKLCDVILYDYFALDNKFILK